MTSQYQILLILPLQAKLLTLITFSSLLVQTMEFNLLSRSLADLFSTIPKQTLFLPSGHQLWQMLSIQWRWICLEQDKMIIYDAMHLFIPKIKINPSGNPKWFTTSIRHRLNCLHMLRWKFIKHPTEHVALKISTLENDSNLQMAHAKSDYETNLINTYAPKMLQKYINI